MPVQEQHQRIVRRAMLASAGPGAAEMFIPYADAVGMTAIWTTMIAAMAKKSGHKLDEKLIAKVIGASALGASSYALATWSFRKALLWLFGLTPPGRVVLILVGGTNCAVDALLTYRLAAAISGPLSRPDFSEQDFHDAWNATVGNLKPLLRKQPAYEEIEDIIQLFT